jgi:hypothetical protein
LWLTLLLCCSFIKLVEDKLKKTWPSRLVV